VCNTEGIIIIQCIDGHYILFLQLDDETTAHYLRVVDDADLIANFIPNLILSTYLPYPSYMFKRLWSFQRTCRHLNTIDVIFWMMLLRCWIDRYDIDWCEEFFFFRFTWLTFTPRWIRGILQNTFKISKYFFVNTVYIERLRLCSISISSSSSGQRKSCEDWEFGNEVENERRR
jgi:hypothetical protein